MLAPDGATFVSLLDPPDDAAERRGPAGATAPTPSGRERDVVLSSPIILYDHPEVADQSPGDLFDAIEIDEILALRVMTLTDAEKAEARGTDPAPPPSSTAVTPCPPRRWAASTARCARWSRHGRPTPATVRRAVVGPGLRRVRRSLADSVCVGGHRAGAGVDGPAAPVRTVGCAGHVPRRPVRHRGRRVRRRRRRCPSRRHARRRPGRGELMWQGRYLYFRPDEVEPMPSRPDDEIRPDRPHPGRGHRQRLPLRRRLRCRGGPPALRPPAPGRRAGRGLRDPGHPPRLRLSRGLRRARPGRRRPHGRAPGDARGDRARAGSSIHPSDPRRPEPSPASTPTP